MANNPNIIFFEYPKAEQFIALMGDDWHCDVALSLEQVTELFNHKNDSILVTLCTQSDAFFKWLPENRVIPIFLILEEPTLYSAENIIDWLNLDMSSEELHLRILRGLARFNASKSLAKSSQKALRDRDIQLQMNDRLIKVSIELKEAKEEIERLSITDSLTKIHNRRYFDTRLDRDIQQSIRYKTPLSLFILDIDNFKHVNDTYGHQKGDDILVKFASIIKESLRDTDWAARYGGEEFFVVLPQTDRIGGLKTADRLRKKIEDQLSDIEGKIFTASIGLSEFDYNSMDKKTCIGFVDKAMYQSKETGKNKVTYYKFKEKEYCESSSGKTQPSYR